MDGVWGEDPGGKWGKGVSAGDGQTDTEASWVLFLFSLCLVCTHSLEPLPLSVLPKLVWPCPFRVFPRVVWP